MALILSCHSLKHYGTLSNLKTKTKKLLCNSVRRKAKILKPKGSSIEMTF